MRTDINDLLVGERDMDDGDTCFFMGHYNYCIQYTDIRPYPYVCSYNRMSGLLMTISGFFRRTPNRESWAFDVETSTRDQHVSQIVCAGEYNAPSDVKLIFLALWNNHGLFPNTKKNWTLEKKDWRKCEFQDIAGPEIYGAFIRAYRCNTLYPLLFICDVGLLASVIIRLAVVLYDKTDYDDANLNILLHQAMMRMPTPISWIARKLWKRFRVGGLESANLNYFSYKRNSCVGLGEMWNKLTKEF